MNKTGTPMPSCSANLLSWKTPRVKYQTMLDRWWHERRTIEVEAERIRQQLNPYGLKIWD
jgi:hypothetical protein